MSIPSLWGFVRWMAGYEDCPRCNSPLRRTDRIVYRVNYMWVCDVCGSSIPITDRGLVEQWKRRLAIRAAEGEQGDERASPGV